MSLRVAEEVDLSLMLEWRNQESNRFVMFSTELIDQDTHQQWWNKASKDPKKRILIFDFDGRASGVANFYGVDSDKKNAHWGFYLDHTGLSGGNKLISAWLQIEEESIEYARRQLGVQKLICECLESNRQVIDLHKRFGFEITGEFENTLQIPSRKVIELSLHL
jgi:UDP-4-amino-4,6-dideoxy-N-acetyl-beta-L-altrosamine N-acetyltransferase